MNCELPYSYSLFKVRHCFARYDHGLVGALRNEGYDVLYVLESKPGATDGEVLALAFDERRIILTEGKDFGELVYRLKKPAHGIILTYWRNKTECKVAWSEKAH